MFILVDLGEAPKREAWGPDVWEAKWKKCGNDHLLRVMHMISPWAVDFEPDQTTKCKCDTRRNSG